jgi:hypothetical protein
LISTAGTLVCAINARRPPSLLVLETILADSRILTDSNIDPALLVYSNKSLSKSAGSIFESVSILESARIVSKTSRDERTPSPKISLNSNPNLDRRDSSRLLLGPLALSMPVGRRSLGLSTGKSVVYSRLISTAGTLVYSNKSLSKSAGSIFESVSIVEPS